MKNTFIKQHLIGLTILIVSLSACHKPKEDPTKVTANNLAGTYKITAMSYEGDDGTKSDLYSSLDDCQKNSTQTYGTDMSFQEVDTCSPPDSHSGTWSLPSSSKLIVDGVGVDIVLFDGHTLVISMPFETDNQVGKIKETLTKQ